MGSWGKNIYDNDFAMDIKGRYEEKLHLGASNDSITEELIQYYADEVDPLYQMLFSVIIADVQWNHGMLTNQIKKRALYYLDNESLMDQCLSEVPELKEPWKTELVEMRERIMAPYHKQKLRKKLGELYKCPWSIGDIFEYQLRQEKNSDYYGKYTYFRQCGEKKCYPGHICPEVYFYAGMFNEPQNVILLNDMDYLPVSRSCHKDKITLEFRTLLISDGIVTPPKDSLRKIGHIESPKSMFVEARDALGVLSYPIEWDKIEKHIVNIWDKWNMLFKNGKLMESYVSEFREKTVEKFY